MSNTATAVSITVDGSNAINLSDLPSATNSDVQSTVLPAGNYTVELSGEIYYSFNNLYPLTQVMIFSTTPLTSGNANQWFFAPSEASSITISSDGTNPTYVFIVDQVATNDNSGSITVTFTPVS